jgi:polysaccharide export outer membrane protein
VKRFVSTCVVVVAALAFIGGKSGWAAQAQKNDSKNESANAAPTPAPASTDASYVIGPEDVLNIDVWKEQAISRSVPVRPDGKISLPLLNDVQAAGLTPMQLQTALRDALKKFISDPQVTVIVIQVNSRRIYVLGEVARPGAFPMLPHMTILQALSTAGGFNQFAKESGVYVLRTENGRQLTFPFNYKEVVRGKRADQNIELKPGDTIVVP